MNWEDLECWNLDLMLDIEDESGANLSIPEYS